MDIELVNDYVERLKSVFLNIEYSRPEDGLIKPSFTMLNDLKDAINQLFPRNSCLEVLYTYNVDKPFFGIRVDPTMSPEDATIILSSEDELRLKKYKIEFDSKLFDIDISDEEIAALTIYEISSMMDSSEIFDNIRQLIDFHLVSMDDVIKIRDSVNYAQLIIFAIKDTMYKLSSCLFVTDETDLISNPSIQACGLDKDIISVKNKIVDSVYGTGETMRPRKLTILQWMFDMYKNMQINSVVIVDAMKEAKLYTASRLEIENIDKVLTAVDRIDMSVVQEAGVSYDCSLNTFFEKANLSKLNEASLFKNIKRNGLRAIEDDLYEYTMKVKNCVTAEDAYSILRGINSRLGIVEDYLYQENLNEKEKAHWEMVADAYRNLRINLSKKKFKEKSWGVFIDYNALDELDKRKDED